MSSNLQCIPFFYIIRHKKTNKLYGGAKWGQDANPSTFMTLGGYTTSSNTINDIIDEEGLDAFETVLIITEFGFDMSAYEYETVFLQTNDIANNDNWLNKHNNEFVSTFGSDLFKNNLFNKHGVLHNLQIPEAKINRDNTWNEKYGGNPWANPSIRSGIYATWDAKYGGHPMKNSDVKAGRMLTTQERYGVDHTTQTEDMKEKSRVTSMKNRGVDNISKSPERRKEMSETLTGSTYWNDGIKEFKITINQLPEPHWVKGALPKRKRTDEENAANSKLRLGSKLYNDGIKNHQVILGEIPDPLWVEGKIKKVKDYVPSKNFGRSVYNDGIKNYYVFIGEIPELHWIKGELPRKNRNKDK